MTASITDLMLVADQLSKAPQLLPKHARTVPEIFAIILAGQELGWAPMASLRNLSLVQGKVSLTADAMLGLVVRAGIGISWEKDGSDGEAVLTMFREGRTHKSRFTTEDQKRAGLRSDTWSKYTPAMLRARAVSAGIRAFCPDVLSGAYLPGEHPEDAFQEGPGALETLPRREPATSLPAKGAAAVELSAAQGFVPAHPIATDPFVAVDLQALDTEEALVEWMREARVRCADDAAAKRVVWEAFSERCAALEMHPRELLGKVCA